MKTAIATIICLLTMLSASLIAEEKSPMPEYKEYLVRLLGTRPGWPDNMTEDEQKVMEKHYYYLQNLVREEKCLMAGPCMDPVFGLVILRVTSEEEAKNIMDNEPSVTAGVHTYDINPLHVSLMSMNIPRNRYPDTISDRMLVKEAVVAASIDDAWHAWTTTEGLNSFFSELAYVELRVGGPFEIYFSDEIPYGQRGSEHCKILSFLPKKMLSFEWNAPPSFNELRFIHTRVVLMFDELDDGKVKVTLSQLGWGTGENWDGVYNYFDKAWSYVMSNFEKSLAEDSCNGGRER
ncbi:MAG: SRPBCC domain-containing protein [Candidatus Zixiibacteriota bacterium]